MSAAGHPGRVADGPGLVLLDVDGTLTTVRSVWQHVLEHAGRWDGAGDVNLERFLAGDLGYEEFCHLDAKLLRGERYSSLQSVCREIPRREGLTELVSGLRAAGYEIVLISTGLRLVTAELAGEHGIEEVLVNDLEAVDDICTGRAVVHVGEHEKAVHALEIIARVAPRHVIAVGDGISDVALFELADTAIAVGAVADVVRDAADVHLADGDLCGVLPHVGLPLGAGA